MVWLVGGLLLLVREVAVPRGDDSGDVRAMCGGADGKQRVHGTSEARM